ncbi:UNVERIFIED_CONTAM: RNA polymerase sigma-70 factor (ECF subfamily) [Acetivibrio alkalicellulosi]
MTIMKHEDILISKILNGGDMESFSVLVQSYQVQLYNFVYKMINSKEDTEDILQEIFIKVYNNLYKYNNKYSFSTWVYSIAVNTVKSSYKKRKCRPSNYFIDNLIEEISSSDNCPELLIESKEYYTKIIEVIDNLKEKQKTAFVLKYLKNFSYKEIGNIMCISQEAAKMKVHRAKTILAEKLEILRKKGEL